MARYFVAAAAKEVAEEDWLCDEAKERDYWKSAEIRAAVDTNAMDINQDGVVSQEEFSAAGHTDAEFERFDENQDGRLDAAEMKNRSDQLTILAGEPPPKGLACIG